LGRFLQVDEAVKEAHTLAQPSEMAAGDVAALLSQPFSRSSELHSGDVQDKPSPPPDTRQQQDKKEHEARSPTHTSSHALLAADIVGSKKRGLTKNEEARSHVSGRRQTVGRLDSMYVAD
jgi:hypothetical protein